MAIGTLVTNRIAVRVVHQKSNISAFILRVVCVKYKHNGVKLDINQPHHACGFQQFKLRLKSKMLSSGKVKTMCIAREKVVYCASSVSRLYVKCITV